MITHGPRVLATWRAPEPVHETEAWAAALRAARQATGYRGREVRVVLDHRNLIHHLQETPPGKPALVRQLLARQVEQHPFFEEPAVWSTRELPAGKERQRHLLTLIPASVAQAIHDGAVACQLELKGLFAPAAVLEPRLRQEATPGRPVLLATHADGLLCLLAGDAGGQVFFARSVSLLGSMDGERIAQELNRTLLFTQQQFGVVIPECRWWGEGLDSALNTARLREGLTLVPAKGPADEFFFATEVTRLAPGASTNLCRSAWPVGAGSSRGLALAAALLLLASLTFASWVEGRVRAVARETAVRQAAHAAAADAASAHAEGVAETEAWRRLAGWLNPEAHPPAAWLILRRVAALSPTNLVWLSARVQQTNAQWRVRLEGTTRESPAALLPSLERFEAALSGPPLQFQIADSTLRQLLGDDPGAAEALAPEPGGGTRFFVEGKLP